MATTSPYKLLLLTVFYLQSLSFFITTLVPAAQALKTNITFDDSGPGTPTARITYFPEDKWSAGQNCRGCHAQPDKAIAFGGSWHDATYDTSRDKQQPAVLIDFFGTALYVYCIMANTLPSTGTHSKFSFMLDGGLSSQHFEHVPNPTNQYEYNVLVFSQEGLENRSHTFSLLPDGGQGVEGSSLVLFDYFVYTFETADATPPGNIKPAATNSLSTAKLSPNPSATHSPNTSGSPNAQSKGGSATPADTPSSSAKKSNGGAIAGGVIGALLGIAIIVAIAFWCIKRQVTTEERYNLEKVEPYQFAMYGSQTQHSGGPPLGAHAAGSTSGAMAGGYSNVPYSPPPTAMMTGGYTPTTAALQQQQRQLAGFPPVVPVATPPPNENMERWRHNVVPPSEVTLGTVGTSVYNNLGHSRQGSHGVVSTMEDPYAGVDDTLSMSSPSRSGTLSTATRQALQERVDELEQRLTRLTAAAPSYTNNGLPPVPPKPQALQANLQSSYQQRDSQLISDLPYASPPSPSPAPPFTQEVLQQNALMQLQINQLEEEIKRLRIQQQSA